jgi:hypothetical protein
VVVCPEPGPRLVIREPHRSRSGEVDMSAITLRGVVGE